MTSRNSWNNTWLSVNDLWYSCFFKFKFQSLAKRVGGPGSRQSACLARLSYSTHLASSALIYNLINQPLTLTPVMNIISYHIIFIEHGCITQHHQWQYVCLVHTTSNISPYYTGSCMLYYWSQGTGHVPYILTGICSGPIIGGINLIRVTMSRLLGYGVHCFSWLIITTGYSHSLDHKLGLWI